jgi:cytochrome P450
MVFWVQRLHQQYGPTVRVAPDELAFASPQAWQDIYHNKAALKDPNFYGETSNGIQEILRADNVNHARFRRSFTHAFSERSIKEQEPLIVRYVDTMVRKLGAQEGQPVNINRLFSLGSFDIVGDLTFGESLNLLESRKYHYWVDTTWAAVKAFALIRFTRWYPWTAPLATLVVPKGLMQQIEDNFAQCAQRVDRRIATETSRPDIWGLILSQKGERQLSVPEMYANSQTLLLAGGETTSLASTSLLYFLTKNPEKLETLTAEVRGSFASDEEICLTDLALLRYLCACIEEAMRLMPPAPTGLPRIVPAQGMTICGETVPPKVSYVFLIVFNGLLLTCFSFQTIVSVSVLTAVRSSQNFKDPNSFIPERWLKDPEFDMDNKAASQPFSTGYRNCVGKKWVTPFDDQDTSHCYMQS